MKKFLLSILINIILISSASSITLREAIVEAYKNNPRLNAEREAIKVSKENIKISKSDYLPTMTLSGSLSDENTSKLTNRTGVDQSVEDINPLTRSLLIEQKIFEGGARQAELLKSEIGYELAIQKLRKVEQNIIYVGEGNSHPGLYREALRVLSSQVHWIREDLKLTLGQTLNVFARIRYRQPLFEATLFQKENHLYLFFKEPQSAVTPGQFVAWYLGNELVGSGIILE